MGSAIGYRYVRVGQAKDGLAEVEDHVELAVRRNVDARLTTDRHRGGDAVHPVIGGLEPGMAQRGIGYARTDGPAVEGQTVGHHG